MLDGTNLAADSVKDRYDTTHVVRGEDRIQHLALPLVAITCESHQDTKYFVYYMTCLELTRVLGPT